MNSPTGRHVVLGATGAVGRETVRALRSVGADVVSVSRHLDPADGPTHVEADLRDRPSLDRSLSGSAVAYLTVGLPYSSRTWRRDWPLIVRNVVDACAERGTHLVYFDNVYAYGPVDGPMTELTPIRPTTRKGRARADALTIVEHARAEQGLVCTIARSADFYGPGAATSVFNGFALDRIAKGKTPTWLIDAGQPHSMTYTPDIGDALARLGTGPHARGGTWHLPTAAPLSGGEYLEIAGATHRRTMNIATLRLGAPFSRDARETLEMGYQYQRPYEFCSAAYESAFDASPTPYADGIRTSLAAAQVAARR